MIYWFTGQPGAGKTIQATKLKEFLQTEKRNWRKDVFHIDGDDFKVQGYEAPELNFFDMDTTSETPIQSFTKLIHHLKNIDKI